jgi:glucokinase
VTLAARSRDPEAEQVIEDFAWWLALGLVNLTNLLDPEMIVLGGGLVSAADPLLAPLERMYDGLLYAPAHRPRPQLLVAVLGERAGAIGAAAIAAAALSRAGRSERERL